MPLNAILAKIQQVKAEMAVVEDVLKSINQSSNDKLYSKSQRYTFKDKPEEDSSFAEREDLAILRKKSLISNLQSSYILFDFAKKELHENIQSIKERVQLYIHSFIHS